LNPRSLREIDLRPLPQKRYWDADREWREEFIYFLLVDRFHDDRLRTPAGGAGRSRGYTGARRGRFCGGTLKGITRHLDYIQDLGCTALWLSPIFENDGAPDPDSGSYHGYAIRNYLSVDPRFGSKADLVHLVDQAHRRGLRVFLDAVANHAGDLFSYPGDGPYFYSDDHRQFNLGAWRRADYPVPVELRNPAFFHRRGQIRDGRWDTLPETRWGDFFSLKGFNNDETPEGLALQEIVIACHRYWIREADIDGYRMDAVKHMGETAVARFCQSMREYAQLLGKRHFFLFGELVAGDDAINRYAGPNTPGRAGDRTVFYGLDSVLDFPLYWTAPAVLKGRKHPAALLDRYERLRDHALSRGELGRYLVTFLDNHDQIGQQVKQRFASGAEDEQVVAAVGYLLCALGTPCLYYGTEQGLAGSGPDEESIREALFDPEDPHRNYLNKESRIYRGIAALARVLREQPALRFGRMYFRETSGDGEHFGPPQGHPCTLAFARLLAEDEVLTAYNTSTTEARSDHVIVDADLPGTEFRFLYGGQGVVPVRAGRGASAGARCLHLPLAPMQLVVLRRVRPA
jgi:alpha-amylase